MLKKKKIVGNYPWRKLSANTTRSRGDRVNVIVFYNNVCARVYAARISDRNLLFSSVHGKYLPVLFRCRCSKYNSKRTETLNVTRNV